MEIGGHASNCRMRRRPVRRCPCSYAREQDDAKGWKGRGKGKRGYDDEAEEADAAGKSHATKGKGKGRQRWV
eukprot:2051041-Alexandrium_andersonii.AAC.1